MFRTIQLVSEMIQLFWSNALFRYRLACWFRANPLNYIDLRRINREYREGHHAAPE